MHDDPTGATPDPTPDPATAVHQALQGYLNDGEIAIGWCLTIDVTGPDGRRYLAHRAGGGNNGNDAPMAWTALGMLTSSADLARDQLRNCTTDAEDSDGD